MSNKAIKVPKPKKQRQKAKEKEANKTSILSPWRIASGVATLAGILGLVTFLPHITTTISDPVDPNNPFSASVTITNTGVFTLDEVEPFFGLRKMTFGGPAATRTWLGPAQQYTRFVIRGWHLGFIWEIPLPLIRLGSSDHTLTTTPSPSRFSLVCKEAIKMRMPAGQDAVSLRKWGLFNKTL